MFCIPLRKAKDRNESEIISLRTSQTSSLLIESAPRPASSCSIITRASSLTGEEGRQRRRLELEVASQRARANAAERALAEATSENERLKQHVHMLEAQHAALLPSDGNTAATTAPGGALLNEVCRLRLKLHRSGAELLAERQKSQAIQQQLVALRDLSKAAQRQLLQSQVIPTRTQTQPQKSSLMTSAVGVAAAAYGQTAGAEAGHLLHLDHSQLHQLQQRAHTTSHNPLHTLQPGPVDTATLHVKELRDLFERCGSSCSGSMASTSGRWHL